MQNLAHIIVEVTVILLVILVFAYVAVKQRKRIEELTTKYDKLAYIVIENNKKMSQLLKRGVHISAPPVSAPVPKRKPVPEPVPEPEPVIVLEAKKDDENENIENEIAEELKDLDLN